MKMLGNTHKYSLRFSSCRNGIFLILNCFAPEKQKLGRRRGAKAQAYFVSVKLEQQSIRPNLRFFRPMFSCLSTPKLSLFYV